MRSLSHMFDFDGFLSSSEIMWDYYIDCRRMIQFTGPSDKEHILAVYIGNFARNPALN